MWEVAVGHEDVYLHSSLIKKVTGLQSKHLQYRILFSGIFVLVLPFSTVLEGEWLISKGKRSTLTMNLSSSKYTIKNPYSKYTSKNPKKYICDYFILRHDRGIIAAKYDQPGYVHAMRLVAKDDIWAQQYTIRLTFLYLQLIMLLQSDWFLYWYTDMKYTSWKMWIGIVTQTVLWAAARIWWRVRWVVYSEVATGRKLPSEIV